jgi:hypothetical protein
MAAMSLPQKIQYEFDPTQFSRFLSLPAEALEQAFSARQPSWKRSKKVSRSPPASRLCDGLQPVLQ